MKVLCFGLLLAALPASGGQPGVPSAPIALYTHFQQEPPPAVIEGLHDELSVIMAPIGLHFEWRSLNAVHGDEITAELAVVTFKGRCDTAGLVPHSSNPGALGWTHVSDGVILPFSDIDCDRIRTFVQGGLFSIAADDREDALGRAIGRVLAHELYHILTHTAHHGGGGIAKPSYSVHDLLTTDFHFEKGETELMRIGRATVSPEIRSVDASK